MRRARVDWAAVPLVSGSPLTRRRWALCTLFLVPGVALASWVTRTPAIRDLLGASTAEMGLVLFGLSIGSMVGILSSGPLLSRWGARPLIAIGMVGIIASMPVIAFGAALQVNVAVAFGLALFGLGMGGSEVALNVEGADVELQSGRTFLPLLHGCFSLGTFIGAVLGIVATAVGFSVVVHLIAVGVLAVGAALASVRHLPAQTGRRAAADADASVDRPAPVWRDTRLLCIGFIVLAMALAEGTATDWLPLIMVDGHGLDAALGSAVFAVFAASMTIGRFCGGPIVRRFGRAPVLAVSAASAVAGLLLVSLVDHQVVAGAAVVLWGLGASLGFPVAISAAGASGDRPTARVALVTVMGYLAFLVGPPALGFIGEHVGLRTALLAPMVVVLVAIFMAPATRIRR